MDPEQRPITYKEAIQRAEQYAHDSLHHFLTRPDMPVLQEHYLEADYCWMFFRNKDIFIPPEASLRKAAYVVSKKGQFRSTADFSDDPVKLEQYLQTMSEYFRDHGV